MELNLLKSQINPHFLFNSLNSISSLTITDAEKAQDMLIKLSEYLRYALKQKDNKPVTLKEELDNCNRYLEIEKIRFGDKLITNFDIEIECYTKKLPVLILQPLYENAVKHGVYESLVPVKITTKVYMSGSKMNICISNDYDNTAITRKGEGIGLDNVKTRLNLFYNKKSELIIDKQEDSFFTTIILPT
jgi:two-component system, LytTR family, sensor kinase